MGEERKRQDVATRTFAMMPWDSAYKPVLQYVVCIAGGNEVGGARIQSIVNKSSTYEQARKEKAYKSVQ